MQLHVIKLFRANIFLGLKAQVVNRKEFNGRSMSVGEKTMAAVAACRVNIFIL